jgi:drug/metabolite transporter (DMT)-like permease
MRENTRSFVCAFGLIFVTIIWGFAFVVVKNSLDYVPPLYMMAFRFTIASVVLALLFLPKFKLLDKSTFFHGMILGIFLFAAYAFQTVGLQFTTAGKNAFLTTTYVMMVPFLNWFFHKSKPSWNCVLAAIIALIGIGLLSLQGDFSMNRGDVLTIICGFFFAVHIMFVDKYVQKISGIHLSFMQFTVCSVICLICAFIFEKVEIQSIINASISIAYAGVFSAALGYTLQIIAQKWVAPNIAPLIMCLESVFGVLCSAVMLRQMLTGNEILGCVIMLVAIIISQFADTIEAKLRRKKA